MLTRKQVKTMKYNSRAKKVITTSALALGMGLGITAIGSNKVEASTWTARSVSSIQSSMKTQGTTPYTIVWGDTLSTITEAANNNGINVSMTRLAEINKISNIDLIYAGNKISFDGKGVNATMTVNGADGSNTTYNLNSKKPVVNHNSTNNSNSSKNNSNSNKPSNPGNSDNSNNGTTTPPKQNIYTPNTENIEQLIMKKINALGYNKPWESPKGKAPSGQDWVKSGMAAGGYVTGAEVKNDEDFANFLIQNDSIKQLMTSNPSVIFDKPKLTVNASINLNSPEGPEYSYSLPYYYDPAEGNPFE